MKLSKESTLLIIYFSVVLVAVATYAVFGPGL
jgi:hypothetical protein